MLAVSWRWFAVVVVVVVDGGGGEFFGWEMLVSVLLFVCSCQPSVSYGNFFAQDSRLKHQSHAARLRSPHVILFHIFFFV